MKDHIIISFRYKPIRHKHIRKRCDLVNCLNVSVSILTRKLHNITTRHDTRYYAVLYLRMLTPKCFVIRKLLIHTNIQRIQLARLQMQTKTTLSTRRMCVWLTDTHRLNRTTSSHTDRFLSRSCRVGIELKIIAKSKFMFDMCIDRLYVCRFFSRKKLY